MKLDLYTKLLLTITTVSMSILAINVICQNFISIAQATPDEVKWNCFVYKTISSGDANLISNVLNKEKAHVGFSGSAGNIGFTCYR